MKRNAGPNEALHKRPRLDQGLSADERAAAGSEDSPACISCRRRKTKCSRQSPCDQCTRLQTECMYDCVKEKPGMKTGAIQMLTQRVSNLEQMLLGQGLLLEPLLKYATGLGVPANSSFEEQTEALKQRCLAAASSMGSVKSPEEPPVGEDATPQIPSPRAAVAANGCLSDFLSRSQSLLPPDDRLNAMVDIYFTQLHPWIPILHEKSFRQKLSDGTRSSRLVPILLAITSVCMRLDCSATGPQHWNASWSLDCRNTVILQGMDKFSVENLQALVIIAFDMFGAGRGPSAWSIVGSMTRTVEQLQLSVIDAEDTDDHTKDEFLIRRMKFLRPAKSWSETEERRRVFWSVFLMDRFCSVATGWNNSLTCDDVRCRLPCEGSLWAIGTPVRTPRFGIADRSGASLQSTTPASERHLNSSDELEVIGGFAFNVEASESLNLVTRFFLQHPVRFDEKEQMEMWYMRFKELDLRLTKWRIYLPAKWRNASALNQDGIMDPNLTLAHMTHNTAVIQLHQAVAYPEPKYLKMASQSSVEVCLTAACEIATIAQQFLAQSTAITNPQFSFCLFIAGRVLLSHASFYSVHCHESVDTIVELLQEIARRWAGIAGYADGLGDNLASRFGKRLRESRDALATHDKRKSESATLDIRRPVYSGQGEPTETETRPASPEQQGLGEHLENLAVLQPPYTSELDFYSPDSISMAFPPLPGAFEHYGFHQHFDPSPAIMPLAEAPPEDRSLNETYRIGSQITLDLPSHALDTQDFSRFPALPREGNIPMSTVSMFEAA